MTFNGLTDKQAEKSRKKHGSNGGGFTPKTLPGKLLERFSRIPVKIYLIILLLYIAGALFGEIFGVSFISGGNVARSLIAVPVSVIPIALNCAAEMYVENRSEKNRKRSAGTLCKVYRCGNTVTERPEEEIVRGDYVLLTEGDIVPAKGIVLHGDITSEGREGSRLIRNYNKEEIKEDVSGEYTLEKGEEISSGYAVIKVTEVGGDNNSEEERPTAGYIAVMCAGLALSLILIALYAVFSGSGAYGADDSDLAAVSAFYLSLVLLASEGLRAPTDFFRRSARGVMYHDGIRAYAVDRKKNIILADKSSLATDGRPFVSGFTDGTGKTYSKFYEVPYPLGTIVARAAAKNTSALINRDKIICADPYERAEMNFLSERIKNTLELEITPELINGELKDFSCKRLVRGPADKLIKVCTAYYDGAGKRKPLSNTAALTAMAEELSFQGSRVFTYAAEAEDGEMIFIGMITLHEKLRNNAAAAYKILTDSGIKVVLLDPGGSEESVSIADKAVTGALRDEIISYDKLAAMPDNEAAKLLPKLKIITSECDKEHLIGLAKASRMSVGAMISGYEEIEKTAGADVLYASSSSCAAVCRSAHAVLSGGMDSLVKYSWHSNAIKASASWYTALRLIVLVMSAVLMSPPAVSVLGSAAYYGAIIMNILLSAAFCVIFSRFAAMGNK